MQKKIIRNLVVIGMIISSFPPAKTPPVDPGNLVAKAVSSSQIDLSWNDNSDNEKEFKIERSTTGVKDTYSQMGVVGANIVFYSDTGLAAGATYYYRVKAYNPAGDSDYSNEASTTTFSGGADIGALLLPSPGDKFICRNHRR